MMTTHRILNETPRRMVDHICEAFHKVNLHFVGPKSFRAMNHDPQSPVLERNDGTGGTDRAPFNTATLEDRVIFLRKACREHHNICAEVKRCMRGYVSDCVRACKRQCYKYVTVCLNDDLCSNTLHVLLSIVVSFGLDMLETICAILTESDYNITQACVFSAVPHPSFAHS